jgi:hypothetical protein
MAKRSPVQELQELATDSNVDLTTLLRKALLVATKLNLKAFRDWIDCELNGYFGKGDVPPYRKLHAKVWLKNPYHGLIPVMFQDSRSENAFCRIDARDPIEGLKHILDNLQRGASSPIFPLTPHQSTLLLKQQNGLGLPPVRTVSENQLASILDAVRTTILEWALKLEQEGILGEGISFTQEEVSRASTSTQIRIENFQGILGNVQDSTVTQLLSINVQKGDWGSLDEYLHSLGIEDNDILHLKEALQAEPVLSGQSNFSKRVSDWVGKMVAKAASGAWRVGIATAGNLLASAIRAYYGGV